MTFGKKEILVNKRKSFQIEQKQTKQRQRLAQVECKNNLISISAIQAPTVLSGDKKHLDGQKKSARLPHLLTAFSEVVSS